MKCHATAEWCILVKNMAFLPMSLNAPLMSSWQMVQSSMYFVQNAYTEDASQPHYAL